LSAGGNGGLVEQAHSVLALTIARRLAGRSCGDDRGVFMRSLMVLLATIFPIVAATDNAAASSPQFVPGFPLYCHGPLPARVYGTSVSMMAFTWASTGAGAASPGPGQCSWADRAADGLEKQSGNGNVVCDFSGAMQSVAAGTFAKFGVARDPILDNCMHVIRYFGAVSPPFSAKPALAPFVRQSIIHLSGVELASLRRGFQVMMSRSKNDTTSYAFQANIHGTYDLPLTAQTAESWNNCEHGSYFFFSWHRMYLYFFDRILRAASGDPNLVLPYWDWSDPDQRALPDAFRLPANSSNPLYLAPPGRPAAVDDGTALLGDSAVYDDAALSQTTFESPPGSADTFGGQIASPMHLNSPHGAYERQPHDSVHTALGGVMEDPDAAAQDPVFWLHHANVDRIWTNWIALGGGRHNPTDAAWLNTQFTFYDEVGNAVYLTGAEIVDTAGQLNYRYDDHPTNMQILYPPPAATRFLAEDQQFLTSGKQTAMRDEAVAPARAREELATSALTVGVTSIAPQRIELGGASARLAVPLTAVATNRIRVLAANNTPHQVYLRLDDIRVDRSGGVYYEIYVNPPAGAKLGIHTPGYVGNLSLFGLKPHAMAGHPPPATDIYSEYNISGLVGDAIARNAQGFTVLLVPRGLFDRHGNPLPVETKVQGTLGTARIIGG
jgi:tyrosinase